MAAPTPASRRQLRPAWRKESWRARSRGSRWPAGSPTRWRTRWRTRRMRARRARRRWESGRCSTRTGRVLVVRVAVLAAAAHAISSRAGGEREDGRACARRTRAVSVDAVDHPVRQVAGVLPHHCKVTLSVTLSVTPFVWCNGFHPKNRVLHPLK